MGTSPSAVRLSQGMVQMFWHLAVQGRDVHSRMSVKFAIIRLISRSFWPAMSKKGRFTPPLNGSPVNQADCSVRHSSTSQGPAHDSDPAVKIAEIHLRLVSADANSASPARKRCSRATCMLLRLLVGPAHSGAHSFSLRQGSQSGPAPTGSPKTCFEMARGAPKQ